jgi:hypothetical protein
MGGGAEVEFYASSDSPNPSLVPALGGNASPSSGTWHRQLFPSGTKFGGEDLPDWGWTYKAPSTCEEWTNTKSGNSGDIRGVNAC